MDREVSRMTLPRRVVLCADDFALTEGVSRGILELARRGLISATNVMSNMEGWPALAADLKGVKDRIGVGLHLNLTTGAPLGPMPGIAPERRLPALKHLMLAAFRHRLDAGELREEIERQVTAFERCFGAPPDFVDGHQHVHVLPVVRSALIGVLAARGYAGRLWLRDPSDGLLPIARRGIQIEKALVVRALSAGFRQAARRAGFATNEGFSGFSPLDSATPAESVFQAAFRDFGPRPVVMCHPGYVDDALMGLDPAIESRSSELAYLGSDAFRTLLRERGIALVPALA
jgi:predicted glycoside hydrolase/deacetylase ChbG (UPF0249 family)